MHRLLRALRRQSLASRPRASLCLAPFSSTPGTSPPPPPPPPPPGDAASDASWDGVRGFVHRDLNDPHGPLNGADAAKRFVLSSQRADKIRESTQAAIRRYVEARMSSEPFRDPSDPLRVPLLERDPSFLNAFSKLSMYEKMGVDWFDPGAPGFVEKVCSAMDDLYGGSLKPGPGSSGESGGPRLSDAVNSRFREVHEGRLEAAEMATQLQSAQSALSLQYRPPDLFGMHPVALGRLLGKSYLDRDVYAPAFFDDDKGTQGEMEQAMQLDPRFARSVSVPQFVKHDVFVAYTQFGVDIETMARYYHIRPARVRAILRLTFQSLHQESAIALKHSMEEQVERNMSQGAETPFFVDDEPFSFQEYFPTLPHLTNLNFGTLGDEEDETALWGIIKSSRARFQRKHHIRAFRAPNFRESLPVPSSKLRPNRASSPASASPVSRRAADYAFFDLSQRVDPRFQSVFVPALYGSELRRLTELEQYERTWNSAKKGSIRGDPISVVNFKNYVDSHVPSQYAGRKPLDAIMDLIFGVEQDTRWHNLPAKTREKLKRSLYRRSLERLRAETWEVEGRFNPGRDRPRSRRSGDQDLEMGMGGVGVGGRSFGSSGESDFTSWEGADTDTEGRASSDREDPFDLDEEMLPPVPSVPRTGSSSRGLGALEGVMGLDRASSSSSASTPLGRGSGGRPPSRLARARSAAEQEEYSSPISGPAPPPPPPSSPAPRRPNSEFRSASSSPLRSDSNASPEKRSLSDILRPSSSPSHPRSPRPSSSGAPFRSNNRSSPSSTAFKSLNPRDASKPPRGGGSRSFHTSAVAALARRVGGAPSVLEEAYDRGLRPEAPPRPSSRSPAARRSPSEDSESSPAYDPFPVDLLFDPPVPAAPSPPPLPEGADESVRPPGRLPPMRPLENHGKDRLRDEGQLLSAQALVSVALGKSPLPDRWHRRPLVIDYWNYVRAQRRLLHHQFRRESATYRKHRDEGAFALYYMLDSEEGEGARSSPSRPPLVGEASSSGRRAVRSMYEEDLVEPLAPPGSRPYGEGRE